MKNFLDKLPDLISSSKGMMVIGAIAVFALLLLGKDTPTTQKVSSSSSSTTASEAPVALLADNKIVNINSADASRKSKQMPAQPEKQNAVKLAPPTDVLPDTTKNIAQKSPAQESKNTMSENASSVSGQTDQTARATDTLSATGKPSANDGAGRRQAGKDVKKLSKGPRITEFTLANGMQAVVIPDHRAPVVTHMMWYKVGAADEPAGKSGIAHFLEHLMFKGTKKIPTGEFSKIIAKNGGQDNAFTSQDVTTYHQRVAKDRLELVMKMEADRMHNLVLSKKDVETEREVIIEERRSRVDNNPSSIFSEQLMASLYMNHPYGIPIIGWFDEMSQLSRQDAFNFYQKFYAPNNAILIVAGDVTGEEVKKLAEKIYGKIPAVKDITKRQRPGEPEHRAARKLEMADERVGQKSWQRHYIAPSYATANRSEAEALDLLMKVLGSSSTGRIYKELVIKQKIASSAGGWYSGSGLDSGSIGFYGYPAGKTDFKKIEAEIEKIIADIIQNGLTQSELDKARNAYTAEYVYANDSQVSLARRYGWALIGGRTVKDVQEWPQRLKAVTLEDIKKVARKFLLVRNSVTGYLSPKQTSKNENKKPG